MGEAEKLAEKLKHPFHPRRIHWRVGATREGRGMPLAYVDARDVMNRMDWACGIEGWQDNYEESPTGRIICTISIKIDGEWISKTDGAGSTGVEAEKGAISDAFKRAAVKFGVGRYLYYIDSFWIDLEQGKYMPRNFDGTPYLPPYEPYAE